MNLRRANENPTSNSTQDQCSHLEHRFDGSLTTDYHPVDEAPHPKLHQDRTQHPPESDDLLLIACQLLHLATTGLVVSRGCTRTTLEFEGYRTHSVVNLIAVADARGEFILALDLLQKWKPDGEHRLGDLLEKAAESYLAIDLPLWREEKGADGLSAMRTRGSTT